MAKPEGPEGEVRAGKRSLSLWTPFVCMLIVGSVTMTVNKQI